jgi:hypothetical protein
MKRKILLFLLLLTANTRCFSPDERARIEKLIIEKGKIEFDYPYEFGDFEVNIIMRCLKHPYFETRFSNPQKILGIGSFGVTIEADFQLFKERPETLPVAVKVNFESCHPDKFEMVRNYVSLMVNQNDVKVEGGEQDDIKVYNLSQHFEKMRSGDESTKNDVPFVAMLYEASVISVYPEDGTDKPPENLSVTVAQLGFSDIKNNFLEHPQESEEILNRNSRNVSKLIVETSFGLWRIYANGFFHGDLKENNIIVSRTKDEFYPMIIDFDYLKSHQDLLRMTIPFKKQILDQSHPNFPKYVGYCENPDALIGGAKILMYLNDLNQIPQEVVSDVQIKKTFKSQRIYVFDINITKDMINLVKLSLRLLDKSIKKNLIRADHPNIINLKKELESLKSSWEKKTGYLTNENLVKVLNEASGLGLTSFTSVNADLNRFFKEIEASVSASSSTQVKTVKGQPGDSKDEVKDILIV